MAINVGARVWTPFKELHHTVQAAVQQHQHDAIQDLDMALRRHRTTFISLLTNPARNQANRTALQQADRNGIVVQGQQSTQILAQSFIQEAIIISDLFELNEFAAVELLLAGESQQSYFPGIPRGLVAVLLYYDGRISVVNSLRSLLQAREGRTWTLGLPDELVSTATRFTDTLVDEGLVGNILNLLRVISVEKEMEKLQMEKALGNSKHRKQVCNLLKEVRSSLAECLFCLACQKPLSKADTLLLIRYILSQTTMDESGVLDTVSLTLLMAALYCFDVRILDQEDAEDIILRLPVVTDSTFVVDIHKELYSDPDSSHSVNNPGLKAVLQFVWGLTLRALSQYPSIQGLAEYCEQDEMLIDQAIKERVFAFLATSVLSNDVFHKEEFFLRQIHNSLADFIVQMPLKMKEIRNQGDETARIILAHQQEGLEPPPTLPHDFQDLLHLFYALYSKDDLNLEMALEYWCPPEPVATPGISGGGFTMTYHYRPAQRQLSLHKFVRNAGDLLPPSLYVPYIRMLCGLSTGPQCAHHAFNLLKMNSMQGGGQVSSVSWEHFFSSLNQYYISLRQEAPHQTGDSLASHALFRPHIRTITPQEVDGLTAVLTLIRTIIQHDDVARVSLYENAQWLPVVCLLGLVSCSTPPCLKAELLLTIAVFSHTPEIANNIWQSLEVSQILPTVQSSSTGSAGGLVVELDEVESRNETFPLTRAFISLIDTLTEASIPAGLGAGYRVPGFDPYLEFLRDNVFLNFNMRAYKDPGEKWEVAGAALAFFQKLVSQYTLTAEDFTEQVLEVQGCGTMLASKPPGYTILVHLLNDSRLLKMILHILHEVSELLGRHVDIPGQKYMEATSLSCLKLIHLALSKQAEFLTLLRESGSAVLVTPMDRLLLGVNPASGRPDHIVNICKYICFNSFLPEHTLYAVQILACICQSPLAIPELVGLLTAEKGNSRNILHGCVEVLEADDWETDGECEDTERVSRCSSRLVLLQCLLTTIEQPAPNLAHYLLGYELRKPVKQTELQDPGVHGSPRTCLHSTLTQLNRGLLISGTPSCITESPKLAGLAYQLIYTLCANSSTSAPTMRYLRTAHDFLYSHTQCLPFNISGDKTCSSVAMSRVLVCQAWLLKALAIELRLTSVSRQRSHTQRLLSLLLEDSSQPHHNKVLQGSESFYDPDYAPYDVDGLSLYGNQTSLMNPITGGVQCQRKLLRLLEAVCFTQGAPSPLELDFLKPHDLEPVLQHCEQPGPYGATYCNVKTLHRLLIGELTNCQQSMAATAQRAHILQEVENVCTHMVDRNTFRECVLVKRATLDGWRQVVEVMLTACPEELLPGDMRSNVILELTQQLLSKVADDDALPELTSLVSGVLLTLTCHLTQCFHTAKNPDTQIQNSESVFSGCLEDVGSCAAIVSNKTVLGISGSQRTLLYSSLQVLLKGLIEHIMRSSSSPQRVMANLYGTLLYYLQIAQKPRNRVEVLDAEGVGVGSNIMNGDSEYEKLTLDNMATISSYGENLIEVVCRYACDGHDVGRMLALSTLNSILAIDKHKAWLNYMTSKGYVEHFVSSLSQDDLQLASMLTPQPEPLKALYIYEAKMSLLTRIAQTSSGAQTLLQAGLMQRLAEFNVIEMRPDLHADRPDDAGFIPSVMHRYRQILFPALKLCLSVLTSMGLENTTANSHVLLFLIGHIDVVMTILRDRHTNAHQAALEELSLVTAVVSRAATDDGEASLVLGDSAGIEFRGHVTRLQRQMLALLPRYCFSPHLKHPLRGVDNTKPGTEADMQRESETAVQLAVGEIACNVTSFCTHLITKSASKGQFSQLLFNPCLVESTRRDLHGLEDMSTVGVAVSRAPNLGVIVCLLRQCTTLFMSAHDMHEQNLRKLDTLTTLSSEELNEICGVLSSQKLSSERKHVLARHRLNSHLSQQSQQLRNLAYIIENCLFLLWRHLDFYLLHCVPADSSTSLFQVAQKQQNQVRRLNESPGTPLFGDVTLGDLNQSASTTDMMGQSISKDELEQLKHDAVTCINESLFKKLAEIDTCYMKSRSRYAFMGGLIRRLKRLLILHTGAHTT